MVNINIPIRFKRVVEAFDDMAKDGRKLCGSSGSEHANESLFDLDLSVLVNSFLERGNDEVLLNVDIEDENENWNNGYDEGGKHWKNLEFGVEEDLRGLVNMGCDEYVKMKIHAQVEKACIELGGGVGVSSAGSKRRLMALLCSRGLDAGLCKSKWEKKGHCPPGKYEYIDVIVKGTSYIVEVSLASEFEIARQTGHYTSLLQVFPAIFVGEIWKLKKIVRLMCNSIKLSMKTEGIPVPPWRRYAYMQAKWLGPYRRTINEVPKDFR